MPKNTKRTKCNNNTSVFDYSLLLKPNGAIKLFDKDGEPLKDKGTIKPPRIKKILNVRTLTIIEAKGSKWAYVLPPGKYYQI